MITGRRRHATLALAWSMVVGLACHRSSNPHDRGWQRIDLADDASAIEVPLAVAHTGRAERMGGRYRALRQPVDTARTWTLTLGDAPYLSVRPLRADHDGCSLVYRIAVTRAAAGPSSGEQSWQGDGARYVGQEVIVDLRGLANEDVRLTLRVDAVDEGTTCTGPMAGLWGSPAVVHRPHVPGVPAPNRTDGVGDDPGSPRPNVLVLSFDALRADALGFGGRQPSLTPALDALAAESDVWPTAYATFNVTNPSFASIFTGLYGKHHGVYDLETRLPDHLPTLGEVLGAAGYATHAIVAAHHLRDSVSGLGRGFATFDIADRQWSAEHATDRAIAWLQNRPPEPFFLWLHLFDPHTPHRPPGRFALGEQPARPFGLGPVEAWQPFRALGPRAFRQPRLAAHRDLYDGEVAYLDRQTDRLLGFLRSHGLLDETLLVVLSDHGENLGEQGIHFRHAGLWDATTRVPLLIRWPGATTGGRRLEGLAQTIDVFPTVLGHLGLDVPANDGLDLGAMPRPDRRFAYAEHQGGLGTMVRSEGFLYTRLRPGPIFDGGRLLFDLRRDPDQRRNRTSDLPELTAQADALLDRWLQDRSPPAPTSPLDDEARARLRALGYVEP